MNASKTIYTMKNEKWFDKALIKKMIKIGIPIIIMMMMFGLTDIIDNLSLGLWGGKNALAAVGLANRIYWMGFVIIGIFPVIFEFLIAQYFGAKNYQKEKAAMRAALLFSVLTSFSFILIVNIWAADILSIFLKPKTADDFKTLELAEKYIKIFVWLFLLEGVTRAYESGVISEGKTKIPTIIMVASTIPNFFFNWLLMTQTSLGFLGCAVSTMIVWVGIVIALGIWIWVETRRGMIHFGINPFSIFYMQDRAVLKLGFSRIMLGLTAVINEFVIITSLSLMSRQFGSHSVAVTSMIGPLFNILLFAGSGIISTKAFFVTKKLGANQLKQAYINDSRLNLYAIILATLNCLLISALAYPMPLIYGAQSHLVKLQSTYCIIAIGISYIPIIAYSTFSASLNAGGKSGQKFISTSLPAIIFELVLFGLIIHWTNFSSLTHFWAIYAIYRALKSLKLIFIYFMWQRKDWVVNVVQKKVDKTSDDETAFYLD